MFAGIVEETGRVERLEVNATSGHLVVQADSTTSGCSIGDSIAVDGCCLTLVKAVGKLLSFDLALETLRRTTLGGLKAGHRVNLERSLKIGDRISGHFVSGHIDGCAPLIANTKDGDNFKLTFEIPQKASGMIAEKASVTLSGVSLTVGEVDGSTFNTYLIPHTWKVTKFCDLKVGDQVNLEVDILARYVKSSLQSLVGQKNEKAEVDLQQLERCGFVGKS